MRTPNPIRLPTHSWHRFWCRPQDRYDLGDAGFLFDPESVHGKQFQPHAVALSQLEEARCLVLLGEPGMGKSATIAQERARFAAAGVLAANVELRRDSSSAAIRAALGDSQPREWRSNDETLTLFLDGLDEGITRNANLADEIIEVLSSLPISRLRVRLSCRTLEWPAGLDQRLGALWTTDTVPLYELLPLRRKDVAIAAADYHLDAETFLEQVIAR